MASFIHVTNSDDLWWLTFLQRQTMHSLRTDILEGTRIGSIQSSWRAHFMHLTNNRVKKKDDDRISKCLVWGPQNLFSAICRWCGPVGFIWSRPSASSQDESQALGVRDHGPTQDCTVWVGMVSLTQELTEFKYLVVGIGGSVQRQQ